jgi:hypothetical protein
MKRTKDGLLKYEKSDIKKGDIVGVCADRMYEFEIEAWVKEYKYYAAKCTKSQPDAIVKVGEIRSILPSQIIVKLGEKGKKFPV